MFSHIKSCHTREPADCYITVCKTEEKGGRKRLNFAHKSNPMCGKQTENGLSLPPVCNNTIMGEGLVHFITRIS